MKKNKTKKGSVLIYTLLVMVAMLVMAIGVSEVATRDIQISSSTAKSTQAIQSSVSGIEEISAGIFRNPLNTIEATFPSCESSSNPAISGAAAVPGVLPDGSRYEVNFYDEPVGGDPLDCDDALYCIRGAKSIGLKDDITRALEFEVPCLNDCMNLQTETVPSVNTYLLYTACEAYNDHIYCFGGRDASNTTGLTQIWRYDPSTGTMVEAGDLIRNMHSSGGNCILWSDDKIYCIAGTSTIGGAGQARDEIQRYDPSTETTEMLSIGLYNARQLNLNRYPYPVSSHSCALSSFNNKVYCFGGQSFGSRKSDVYEFDFLTSPMTIVKKLSVLPSYVTSPGIVVGSNELVSTGVRSGLSCVNSSFDNKIYCFGGSPWAAMTNQIFVYNPDTNVAEAITAELPVYITDTSCNESANKKIYCIGGYISNLGAVGSNFDDVIEFNPADQSVTTRVGKMSIVGRRTECAIIPGQEAIYCFGGQPQGTTIGGSWSAGYNLIEQYVPPVGDWDPDTVDCS